MRAARAIGLIGVTSGFSAQASQYLSRLPNTPTDARKALLAEFIDDLVIDGLWAKLDACWMLANDTAANARVNMVSSSFTLTEVGGLTFTADQGYAGDGSTGYLRTGYTPSIHGSQYQQDSASMGGYINGSRTADQPWALMGSDSNPTGSAGYIVPKFATNTVAFQVNNPPLQTGSSTNAQGMFIASRVSSGSLRIYLYKNGVQAGASTYASTGRSNQEFPILARTLANGTITGYSQDQVGFVFIGAEMTAADAAKFTERVEQYRAALAGTLVPLVIFAGQSNSRGVFLTLGDVPGYLRTTDANIKIWSLAGTTFNTLDNGVNNVEDSIYGAGNWGAEAQFSYLWRQDNPSRTLYVMKTGLVGPLAIDGTQQDWSPQSGAGEYFQSLTNRIAAAKTWLIGQGKRARITDFCWMQGEGDTVRGLTVAQAYEANLRDLVLNVRTKLGGARTRAIVGRISTYSGWTDGATVRAGQAAFVTSDPRSRLVDTDSYPMQGDGFHYTAAGQISLGADMYAASKLLP